jgi:hypothetical protein
MPNPLKLWLSFKLYQGAIRQEKLGYNGSPEGWRSEEP